MKISDNSNWIEINKAFISLHEALLVAICVYGEARGESEQGWEAVINVIYNRVKSDGWFIDKAIAKMSSDVHGVILKKWQFSCFLPQDPQRKILKDIADNWNARLAKTLSLSRIYAKAVYFQSLNKDIHFTEQDPTLGATYYHTKDIVPSWSKKFIKTIQIGNHIFYSEKSVN